MIIGQIGLSATQQIEWKPGWIQEQRRPRFLFRAGGVVERASFEAELAGEYGAQKVYPFEIEREFAVAVNTFLGDRPEEAAQVLEWAQIVDAWDKLSSEEQELRPDDNLPDEERESLQRVRDTCAEHSPAYKALVKRLEKRNSLIPVLAFQWFCTGWEGPELPAYRQGIDGRVASEPLNKLGIDMPLVLQAGGAFAYSLLWVGGQVGNSAQPSKSGEGSVISNSDTRKGAGKSQASAASRKTRSSGSRARSSQR